MKTPLERLTETEQGEEQLAAVRWFTLFQD